MNDNDIKCDQLIFKSNKFEKAGQIYISKQTDKIIAKIVGHINSKSN